jgi:hypothetical protein
MRIRWENITPLVLIVILIVLLIELPPVLLVLSEDFGVGIMALGLVCVTILGIFVVLSRRR